MLYRPLIFVSCLFISACSLFPDYSKRPKTTIFIEPVAFNEATHFYGFSINTCQFESVMNRVLLDKDEDYALQVTPLNDGTSPTPYAAKFNIDLVRGDFDSKIFISTRFYNSTSHNNTRSGLSMGFPFDTDRQSVNMRFTIEVFKNDLSLDKKTANLSRNEDGTRCGIVEQLADSAARYSLRWISDVIAEDTKDMAIESSTNNPG